MCKLFSSVLSCLMMTLELCFLYFLQQVLSYPAENRITSHLHCNIQSSYANTKQNLQNAFPILSYFSTILSCEKFRIFSFTSLRIKKKCSRSSKFYTFCKINLLICLLISIELQLFVQINCNQLVVFFKV